MPPLFASKIQTLCSPEKMVMGLGQDLEGNGLQVCTGAGVGLRPQWVPGQAVLGEVWRLRQPQAAGTLSESRGHRETRCAHWVRVACPQ